MNTTTTQTKRGNKESIQDMLDVLFQLERDIQQEVKELNGLPIATFFEYGGNEVFHLIVNNKVVPSYPHQFNKYKVSKRYKVYHDVELTRGSKEYMYKYASEAEVRAFYNDLKAKGIV